MASDQFNVKARHGEGSELRDAVISGDNKHREGSGSLTRVSQDNISLLGAMTLTLTRKVLSPLTFRERVALNLRDLDGEGAGEGGSTGDDSQHDGVVVVQPHVNVH